MNENELKEMEHIGFILSDLLSRMGKLYGNESVAMDIDTNGFRHSVDVRVWVKYKPYETTCYDLPKSFTLAPWHSYDENERAWGDIIKLLP